MQLPRSPIQIGPLNPAPVPSYSCCTPSGTGLEVPHLNESLLSGADATVSTQFTHAACLLDTSSAVESGNPTIQDIALDGS